MRRRLLAVLLAAVLGACSPSDDGRASAPTPGLVRIPRAQPGEIVLFARHDNTFLAYDVRTGQPGTERTNAPNFFGYEFSSLQPVYTAGDSLEGGFVAVERTEQDLVHLATTPPGTDLLPLAADGRRTFFVRSATDPSPGGGREVVELEGDHLRALKGHFGDVYSGALAGDELFLTVFHPEAGNTFEVLRVDLERSPAGQSPVRRGLSSGRLVSDGRDVYWETADGISNGRRTLPCHGLCYFVPTAPLLLDYLPVGSRHTELGNVLLLRDSHTGRVIDRRPGVVDFAVEGSSLILYTWQGVVRESLKER